ncbi:MAG: hypothetical protein ACI9NY_002181, partial [Kiritimatiellia bacterium]
VQPKGLPESVFNYIVAHQLYGFTEKKN